MPVHMGSCPGCRATVAVAALERLGGVCVSCLSGFVLEEEKRPAPELPLAVGSTFRGLEVLDVLGWGGMGVVYRCHRPDLDRTVALKILNPALAADEDFARRFTGEARALAALNHPGIVQVHDFGREGDLYFLVLEYVDGAPLRRLIEDAALSPSKSLRIVSELCAALEYAHGRGVVHRDIKPENVLIDRGGAAKLADFGLAKMGDLPATRASRVLGTPHYLAPELLAKEPSDHRADLYSLGVVFYEMLTGEVPVGRFPPPSARAGVDSRLDPVVLKALERDPARRYVDAAEFRGRVDALAKKAPRRRFPRRTILYSLAALAAAVGVWAAIRPMEKPRGIDRWHWVNRGETARTTGDEISVPPYRDGPLITAAPEGHALGDRSRLRFQLFYEIHPQDEPWILVIFDGPRDRGGNARTVILFPEGDHKTAFAHIEVPGTFTLLHLDAMPEGRPAPGRWHDIEVSWDGEARRLGLRVDGRICGDRELDGEDLSGPWRFGFGGAARGVRIRDVNVVHER